MRKKVKPVANSSNGAVEMVIKINNEDVVVEVIPPANMLQQQQQEQSIEETYADAAHYNVDQDKSADEAAATTEEETDVSGDERPSGMDDDKRFVHNKSEKLRRAQLRASMERLKSLVPLEDNTQKYTTASLLRRTRLLIQKLEEKERKSVTFKEQLQKEQRYLRKRLEQLQPGGKGSTSGSSSGSTTSKMLGNHQKAPISAGTHNTANKYPPNLPLSQSKPPPILKRKPAVDSADLLVVDSGGNSVSSQVAMSLTAAEVIPHVTAGNPAPASFELVTTASSDQLLPTLTDNYCIIIDAGGTIQHTF